MKLLAITLLAAGIAFGQDAGIISNAELSKKFSLKDGDAKMREGHYLEAAVAYRNSLLEPGDREAVRVPFALALLAAGETAYAGIEIRRAQLFYADFARLHIDLEDLFGSRDTFLKMVEVAEGRKLDGDGGDSFAAFAYARLLLGQAKESTGWTARLVAARGDDGLTRVLKDLAQNQPSTIAPTPVPKGLEKFQSKVDKIAAPAAPSKKPFEPATTGTPARSPIAFIELSMKPKEELFEK